MIFSIEARLWSFNDSYSSSALNEFIDCNYIEIIKLWWQRQGIGSEQFICVLFYLIKAHKCFVYTDSNTAK